MGRSINLAWLWPTAFAVAFAMTPAHAEAPNRTLRSQILIPTRIVFTKGYGTQPIDYVHRTVTIAGTLLAGPPGGPNQPVPGEVVHLKLDVADYTVAIPLGDVTTDANGQFTLTTTVPSPGDLLANFDGDATYAGTERLQFLYRANVPASDLPATISVDPIAPAVPGATITYTGKVTMTAPDGSQVPSPYVPVDALSGDDCGTISNGGWTDGNGQFTVTTIVNPGGICLLETSDDSGNSGWSGTAVSGRVIIPLSVYPTKVEFDPGTLDLPQQISSLNFAADAYYQDASGEWNYVPGATSASLYLQLTGSSGWMLMASTSSTSSTILFNNISGYLPGGQLAIGCWQIMLDASPSYLAGRSPVHCFQVTISTLLNDFRLHTAGRSARLTATLDDAHQAGPLGGQPVYLYYQTPGHQSWHRVASARTNPVGKVSFLLTGRPVGHYRARYPGATIGLGTYLSAVTSPIRYAG
jgi:hypothetical protein